MARSAQWLQAHLLATGFPVAEIWPSGRSGADGLPAARRSGAAIDRSTDDEVPGGRETSTYDVEDKPFADNGVFRKVRGWDAVDVTSTAVFGLHGEPAVGLEPASERRTAGIFISPFCCPL